MYFDIILESISLFQALQHYVSFYVTEQSMT